MKVLGWVGLGYMRLHTAVSTEFEIWTAKNLGFSTYISGTKHAIDLKFPHNMTQMVNVIELKFQANRNIRSQVITI